MTRRAELEETTRRRITESAVSLHEQVGPARTSITAIAERAGVRRSTVYRHFPDENALFDACSSHFRALNPPPDVQAWAAIKDPAARTETALRELYSFYERTHRMYDSLFRDETLVPAVARRLRDFHGYMDAMRDALLKGRGRAPRRMRAAIGHAIAFGTWRSLTQDQGLTNDDAAALMSTLVRTASRR
ncbi:MAG: TetR/AcrR family transcriptional regulator [Gaiellaceae bacterium]|jgi:AcrR family transcriptional regulator